MSEDQNSGRGRRRRRRGGRNRSNNNNNNGGNNGNRGNRRRSGGGGGGNSKRTPKEKFGGREPTAENTVSGPIEMSAFELFCAYHLGITPNNGYKKPAVRDVARYFNCSIDDVTEALKDCGLDNQTARALHFDFSYAQLDVKVAPDGIDKREIARPFFEEYVDANPDFVDIFAQTEDEESESYDDEYDEDYDSEAYDDEDYDSEAYEDSEAE